MVYSRDSVYLGGLLNHTMDWIISIAQQYIWTWTTGLLCPDLYSHDVPKLIFSSV